VAHLNAHHVTDVLAEGSDGRGSLNQAVTARGSLFSMSVNRLVRTTDVPDRTSFIASWRTTEGDRRESTGRAERNKGTREREGEWGGRQVIRLVSFSIACNQSDSIWEYENDIPLLARVLAPP
jgi:hypothetical protein